MNTLRAELSERRQEFHDHLKLAQALDRRLVESEDISIGEITLNARHLMTIKSGLIIHLYNIVEAMMTRTIDELGEAVKPIPPNEWSTSTLKEWLRLYASPEANGNEESRLKVVHGAALRLLEKEPHRELKFKKPPGTWSDKVIKSFSERLNVSFPLTREIVESVQPSPKYGDKTPLCFLADRRNAISHGRRSFERGADDLTLQDIDNLANLTLRYLEAAIDAFQSFVDGKKFMAAC